MSVICFNFISFVRKASEPISRAAAICKASTVLSAGLRPISFPAVSAIPSEISIKARCLPCLRKSANFLASFSSPLSIGLGRTSVRVMTDE